MLLDDVLREIGECGTYQILMYFFLGLAGIPTGWQNMGITFFGANMDHWCFVPRLGNLTDDIQKYIAIPRDPGGVYSQCEMFDINYENLTDYDVSTWNRSSHLDTPIVPCRRGWQYDRSVFSSTLVSQFDLVCGKSYRLSLIQTIYMCGFISGCVIFGQLSDRMGRHMTLTVSLVVEVLFATAAAVVPHYAAYVAFRFFVGAAAAGAFTTVFVMSMEMIGPRYRLSTGIGVQVWFAVGLMTLPLLAYFVRDHIKLQLICALSPTILWSLAWITDESPRWLITHRRDEKSMQLLNKMARFNSRKLPESLDLEDNRKHQATRDVGRQYNLTDLFRTPGLRKAILLMWLDWFATSMAYYGLSLGVDVLPGSLFLNSFLQAVIELPSYIFITPAMQYAGRKLPNLITLLAAGICSILVPVFLNNPGIREGATVFLLLGKFFVSANFALIYVYTAELFPTVVRQVAVGSSSTCARIGSLLQPQIQHMSTFWAPSAFVVYGLLSISGGILSVFLPETRGRSLPETLEEGEKWARTARISCLSRESESLDVATTTGLSGEEGSEIQLQE